MLSALVLLGSVAQAGWDQSTERWEMDCNAGSSMGCNFAGMCYKNGEITVWNGKTNDTKKIKKNYAKAASLYKKGCKLGDKDACSSYKKLKNKVLEKNYSIRHIGDVQTIYTILGKEKCFLFFDENKNLQKSTCKKIINSKGVKIYCTPSKKVCKTESEIIQAIK